jgi:hypothetical protein
MRIAAVIALLLMLVAPATASARRSATRAESRAMWRVVDASGKCQHARGVISTVHSSHYRYGSVTVADAQCGNGTYVLRRPLHSGRWRTVAAGSDWGAPDRCGRDRKVIPLRVMRDLFASDICAGASTRR